MTDLQKLQNNNWYVNMKKYRIPQVQYYDEQMVIVNGVSYTRKEPTPIVIQEDENTIVVGGVKYQRMEDPKPPTLYDALYEKGGMYSSVCDTVVEIVDEWLPDEVEVDTEEYNAGWNACLEKLRLRLK
jgi:hypothetical protein